MKYNMGYCDSFIVTQKDLVFTSDCSVGFLKVVAPDGENMMLDGE